MRAKVTWLIITAVTAIVVVGVVDAVRGSSSSNPEAAHAAAPVSKPSTTTAPSVQTATETVTTTAPVAPADVTVTAIESASPKRLPSCATDQLGLTFTVSEGLAGVVLRRVTGEPCHHGRAPIGFTVRDQSGDRVAVFGGNTRTTPPANFSNGYEQLIDLYPMSCDPEETFVVVATVGSYVVRRTLPGTKLPCNHG